MDPVLGALVIGALLGFFAGLSVGRGQQRE